MKCLKDKNLIAINKQAQTNILDIDETEKQELIE